MCPLLFLPYIQHYFDNLIIFALFQARTSDLTYDVGVEVSFQLACIFPLVKPPDMIFVQKKLRSFGDKNFTQKFLRKCRASGTSSDILAIYFAEIYS